MILPAGYILHLPPSRRAVLLDEDRSYFFGGEPSVAEPVDRFDHSRRAPSNRLLLF
jgi:hypothetical protein